MHDTATKPKNSQSRICNSTVSAMLHYRHDDVQHCTYAQLSGARLSLFLLAASLSIRRA